MDRRGRRGLQTLLPLSLFIPSFPPAPPVRPFWSLFTDLPPPPFPRRLPCSFVNGGGTPTHDRPTQYRFRLWSRRRRHPALSRIWIWNTRGKFQKSGSTLYIPPKSSNVLGRIIFSGKEQRRCPARRGTLNFLFSRLAPLGEITKRKYFFP